MAIWRRRLTGKCGTIVPNSSLAPRVSWFRLKLRTKGKNKTVLMRCNGLVIVNPFIAEMSLLYLFLNEVSVGEDLAACKRKVTICFTARGKYWD